MIIAYLYVIEFKKRGLPHYHFLFWLHPNDKLRELSQIDKFVSAEIPNPEENPIAYYIVTEFMIHGSCGYAKTTALCMKIHYVQKNFQNSLEKKQQ